MTFPKILSLDIETSPIIVYKWDLRDQHSTPLSMMVDHPRVLCFAAKMGNEKTRFFSEQVMSHEDMIWAAHGLLSGADIVETWNGDRFDIPWLQASFLEYKMPPPSPYKSLDLYKTAKRFRFPSLKLEHFSKRLGLAGKIQNSGIDLWTRFMAGDKQAGKEMKKYNIQDVDLLPEIRAQLTPWLPTWFNLGTYLGKDVCPKCGGENLIKDGFATLTAGRYQTFNCAECGAWSRSSRKEPGGSNIRGT